MEDSFTIQFEPEPQTAIAVPSGARRGLAVFEGNARRPMSQTRQTSRLPSVFVSHHAR